MGPLSNSQRNVTKPRARFSAPLEAPHDPLHSGMATLAAVPPDPISWQWNTSVGTPQTPPGPEAVGCGHFLKPGGSEDALCTTGQPRWVYQMCLHMSCHWCWLIFFFFFEECFLFPRICLKESHRTAVADGHDTSASPLAGGRTLEARPGPLREGHPVLLEVTWPGIKGTLR